MQFRIGKIRRLANHMHVEMPDGSGIAIDGGPANLLAWARGILRESSDDFKMALAVLLLHARRPNLREQDLPLLDDKDITFDIATGKIEVAP
jgi:hypothetical protein